MKTNLEVIELTQKNIESMIYIIRGQKVMLDFDLARIYGYTTKAFNQQVKNNIEKFPEDFMFQLNDVESDFLSRSKNLTAMPIMQTAGIKGGRTSRPYAFTEQGIYMLMTVLKGELAIKQSLALIRLFKQMKDYISSNVFLGYNEVIKLTKKVEKQDRHMKKIDNKLEIVMDYFMDSSTYKHFLILNGERLEAEEAYEKIYSLANQSIIIIDDYISIKTLRLLRHADKRIAITIFSDNVSKDFISDEDLINFENEYDIKIALFPTHNKFHDRYIMIDYKTDNEKLFDCGASSKDAGNKVTTIMLVEKPELYHSLFDELLEQK